MRIMYNNSTECNLGIPKLWTQSKNIIDPLPIAQPEKNSTTTGSASAVVKTGASEADFARVSSARKVSVAY